MNTDSPAPGTDPGAESEDPLRRLRALIPGFVPEWTPGERGADAALLRIAARLLHTVAQRLAQAPDKNRAAFYGMLGLRQTPPQSARVPVVFRVAEGAADVRLPAGTRVAAPPPPGASPQLVYETEQSAGLAAADLREIVSLWPGRDQYLDHSPQHEQRLPLRPFDRPALRKVPHELYLGHDLLLNLSGRSSTAVSFDLTTPGSEHLDIRWEYWDGTGWRGFAGMRPSCGEGAAEQLDGTDGMRRSGTCRLETDCAETARTSIDGVETFWVRGRLAEMEPLPPDPARVLPEVDGIRLSSRTSLGYAQVWRVSAGSAVPQEGSVAVLVRDATGVPLENVVVGVQGGASKRTNRRGRADIDAAVGDTLVVTLGSFEQEERITKGVRSLDFTLDMPSVDQAFAADAEVDLSKPFLPFGAQPGPGAVFHFSCEEALGKPGARLRVYVRPAALQPGGGTALPHVVSWEYFNGRQWTSVRTDVTQSAGDFTKHGFVDLPPVADDMAAVEVGGVTARWMRVRLVGGGYGVTRTVMVGTPATKLSLFDSRPPVLADFRLGYTWQQGPFAPEHVRTYNDFRFEDRTQDAAWPGGTFQPYKPAAESLPALYLGFDGGLPVDSVGIFFDLVAQAGGPAPPRLVWEYFNGSAWARLSVLDGTRDLRVPGVLTLVGPQDSAPLARFGTPRHWLRARLAQDGPPAEPRLDSVQPNAVWAVQRQTLRAEPLGTSTGTPSQVYAFRQVPLLPERRIEVRELSGPRAAVEWRLVAAELFGADERAVRALERDLAADAGPEEVRLGPLRLRRDRLGRVSEAWVLWEEREDLDASGPTDRHLAVDPLRGRVLFGDGTHGRVPPVGAAIVADLCRTGGGSAGNVGAHTVSQVLGAAAGIEEAGNPVPAEGGADVETFAQLLGRAPATLRARGRAVTAGDYEALARAASPSVARVRAFPGRGADGRPTPGQVTLVVVPFSGQQRPSPSFGLCEAVRRSVAALAPAGLAEAVTVIGPAYLDVGVDATLVPRDPTRSGGVEQAARHALLAFFDPIRGGPDGAGLEPGGELYASDLAAVLEGAAGVDRVEELALLLGAKPQGDVVRMPTGRLAAAGALRLRLTGE
ncbi:putative baseplate assembly protein [Streptomyces sp. NBC_00005]|uniref:putative baseplate assembly protein n=1 Tax=Streptomyces sp. NBC_00005 TaxID=2903609 RepID=UPI00324E8BD9